ncbi:hypothetical protein LBMAG42_55550 [Deltaproteobacteria bacterium]|nr:hypothetical protein LBMAG42_55550 [Deltaproteobacteria bacterium]
MPHDTFVLPLLDADEAAALLNIPRATLDSWLATGRVLVPHLRLSAKTIRFDRRELDVWIRERSAAATAALAERRSRRAR